MQDWGKFKREQEVEKHDIDYFIKVFNHIPREWFGCSFDKTGHDAWYWLSEKQAEELYFIIKDYGILLEANDGLSGWHTYGGVRDRVVGFLEYVKACIANEVGT